MDIRLDEEQQLVELSKSDPEAFGSLFEHYYDEIFNFTLRRTVDVEAARDITAETFLKALKGIHQFTWKKAPFSAWLYRIAINEIAAYYRKGAYRAVSLDEMRSKGYEPASPYNLEEEIITAQKTLEKHEDLFICSNAILKIPQKYQDVIVLRFFAGKKISEIGDILGKPEGTVKSLLHRGLEKLKISFYKEKRNLFKKTSLYKKED